MDPDRQIRLIIAPFFLFISLWIAFGIPDNLDGKLEIIIGLIVLSTLPLVRSRNPGRTWPNSGDFLSTFRTFMGDNISVWRVNPRENVG